MKKTVKVTIGTAYSDDQTTVNAKVIKLASGTHIGWSYATISPWQVKSAGRRMSIISGDAVIVLRDDDCHYGGFMRTADGGFESELSQPVQLDND